MRVGLVMAAAVGLGVAWVTPAWAGCLQSELKGTWQLYAVGGNPSIGTYTVRCTLTVAKNGTLTGATCADDFGFSGDVTSGRLRLMSTTTCKVTGDVDVDGDPLLVITHATLDKDKLGLAGTGTDDEDGIFQFHAVKR